MPLNRCDQIINRQNRPQKYCFFFICANNFVKYVKKQYLCPPKTNLYTIVNILLILSIINPNPIPLAAYISLGGGLLLLLCSAFVSSSETAFFSLTPTDVDTLRKEENRSDKTILALLEKPQMLLATILITNNFVNIALTLLLAVFTSALFDFGATPAWVEFVIQTIVITFLLLLFGEITPKVFATLHPLGIARFASPILYVLNKILYPFSWILSHSTTIIEKRMEGKHYTNLSMDELSQAVELTEIATEEEKDILEGITKFGSIQASDIMRPRMDIVDIDIKASFKDVMHTIVSAGYSRIPVYAGTSDKIKGILYAKDLIPHIDKPANFRWQTLIRPAYFVPESKHLDDLLAEFQAHKVHLAIVVDEYGGTAGLVTLEDIIEEIVGDISDEYDEEEKQYLILPDGSYLFEGKILLNDFYKVLDIDEDTFAPISDEVETLAGLLLEIKGDFPKRDEQIVHGKYIFEVVSIEKRRIQNIKLTMQPDEE